MIPKKYNLKGKKCPHCGRILTSIYVDMNAVLADGTEPNYCLLSWAGGDIVFESGIVSIEEKEEVIVWVKMCATEAKCGRCTHDIKLYGILNGPKQGVKEDE